MRSCSISNKINMGNYIPLLKMHLNPKRTTPSTSQYAESLKNYLKFV